MITVAILTKNNERTIQRALESAKSFSEVIVLDSGSQDATLKIASSFKNVKIFEASFSGFGAMRNLAAEKSKNDWILALDSDEELSSKVLEELTHLSLDPNAAYSFPFFNYYNEKHIKCCGWHPERHIRLYNRKTAKFSQDLVHEALIKDGLAIKMIKYPINHYSIGSVDDFLNKIQFYSTLFAKQHHGQKSSFFKAFSHGVFSFFKSYIIKKGFLGGKEGFIISVYNANSAFYKYLKLHELNNKNASDFSISSH